MSLVNKNVTRQLHRLLGAALLLLVTAGTTAAQDKVVADFLNIYTTAADKMVQLGNAIPAETYSWRPSEGIRSVRESMLHTASANYYFGSRLGGTLPDGINPQTLEQSDLSKEKTVEALQKSISFVEQTVKAMKAPDFEAEMEFFGNTVTKRQVMFLIGDHTAEHLGQLIAYARMNGVAPPWSQ